MMELTHSRVVSGEKTTAGRDHDLVSVTESVELDGPEMEHVVNKALEGEFTNTSARGRWEKIKEIGILTERQETVTGGF